MKNIRWRLFSQYFVLSFFVLSFLAEEGFGQVRPAGYKPPADLKGKTQAFLPAVQINRLDQKKASASKAFAKAPAKAATGSPAQNDRQKKDFLMNKPSARGPNTKAQINNRSPYFFRPLLIQGKKRLIQKTKEMRAGSGNIVESELFFVNIDFRQRIFE